MASPSRFRPLLAPVLILLAGAILLAALVLTRPQPPAPERQRSPAVVNTRTIEPHAASPHLTLYGRLESPRSATLTAAVAAKVEAVPVREGRTVDRGQRLVALERADPAAVLAERRADLAEIEARIQEAKAQNEGDREAVEQRQALEDLAQRALERAQRLAERDLGSSEEVDNARQVLEQARLERIQAQLRVRTFSSRLEALQAERRRAQAQVEQARRDLARTRIDAPFRGRITQVDVAPGERVRVGDPLVGIYDTEALEVRATIPGPRVPAVRRAAESEHAVSAEVTVDGRTFRAQLDRFGGRSREGTSGIEGLFRLVGSYPADLPLGRFAELTVSLPPEPGVVRVPHSALYERDRIFVFREGRLVGLTVERVGQRVIENGPDEALVRSEELHSGDRVVTTQLPDAREGLAVRLAEPRAEDR